MNRYSTADQCCTQPAADIKQVAKIQSQDLLMKIWYFCDYSVITYDFGLNRCWPGTDHCDAANASSLSETTGKTHWESPMVLLAKAVRVLPTKQKCFKISCFGYEEDFIRWVFLKEGGKWQNEYCCDLCGLAAWWLELWCGMLIFTALLNLFRKSTV